MEESMLVMGQKAETLFYEKDERYARWSAYSVSLHLRFASQLTWILAAHAPNLSRLIKRNLFNVVLNLGLSNPTLLHILGGTVSNTGSHSNLVSFFLSHRGSRKVAKAVYRLIKNAGRKCTMK